ncbi:uncharacterized protein EKO05_0002206 [Ascochyta rabiei]|uniref:DUF7707 domain-containing protein n=1 Tax=Didymella rabiei TaxID=5454 RepID=A0A163JFU1_DIDRA|nr:uncharacterized protein EKO05_0002206 [Ascochyta rabiei]KZM26333.1 hypothetical protein ST47_g2569 [Ascochyta rabiei]UPX11609.1 hypothetical protein EKO05_0002206 [Ascochyta rabiei]
MRSTLALSLAAFAGLATAQTTTQNDYPYQIDPQSVSSANRQYWCDQNVAQCPLICLQQPGVTSSTTEDNECDPDQLTYSCVCDNGVAPNITQYSQTLPFYICQEWGNQCVTNCNGDNTCANSCRADHPCGAQSPFLGNSTTSSTMSSTSAPTGSAATNTIPVTGFGGGGATSTASGGSTGAAAATFVPGAATSMAVLFGSVFLGFAVLL